MSVSLNDFINEEQERIKQFLTWYEAMSKINPEHYPLTLPDDNAGAWNEMLADFEPSNSLYQLPTKGDSSE